MNKQNITLEEIELHLSEIRNSKKSPGSVFAGFIKTLFQIALLPILVYLVFAFLLGIAQVQQPAMQPNFSEGDIVIFNRLETDYEFGDVIIASDVQNGSMMIQRVIGVPGDTVQITPELTILVNGEKIRESWQSCGTLTQGQAYLPITLDEGEYFVLVDNRDCDSDSRNSDIGTLHKEDILGIVVYRFKMSK